MQLPQPDNAPPEQWQPRRDDTTRRLVAGFQSTLGEALDEVSSVSIRLDALKENTVTHRALLGWACAFAVAIIGAAWALTEKGAASTSRRIERTEATIEAVQVEGKRDTAELRRDVRDLYRAVLTRRRQDRLEQPVAEEVP